MANPSTVSGGWRTPVLVVLALAFAGRVAAQLIQAVTEVSWLPAFSAWQSGALPYPALLVSQLLIIAVQVELIRRSVKGRFAPSRTLQVVLGVLGSIYALVIVVRLAVGTTIFDGHSWFDAPIPSFFHLVLASFVLVLALPFNRSGTARDRS